MRLSRVSIFLVVLAGVLLTGCATESARMATRAPRADALTPRDIETVRAAKDRGIAFLLERQNPNGSWGSSYPKAANVLAPAPGAHRAFKVGTTALCVMALCEAGGDKVAVDLALLRARDFLFNELPKLRRDDPETVYCVWGHAYSIQALIMLRERYAFDTDTLAEVDRLIADQLRMLDRTQSVHGGWGYYTWSSGMTSRPSLFPTSFTTATAMVSLHAAHEAGYEVSPRMVKLGMAGLAKARLPDFAYGYYILPVPTPRSGLDKPAGSLARSQSCNLATYLWDDPRMKLPIIEAWLDRFFARQGWLSVARKQQEPHKSYYAISGYFYYYGFYYAALCTDLLDAPDREYYYDHMAATLLERQETNGSWWDYAMYRYHEEYGTAFAVMTLNRCLPPDAP
jgi:hypothetical protein